MKTRRAPSRRREPRQRMRRVEAWSHVRSRRATCARRPGCRRPAVVRYAVLDRSVRSPSVDSSPGRTREPLRSALIALKDHFEGNIWCVFGCGGNRDKGKRPMMGEIAERYANKLIIADDNPRNEQGDEIVQHILSGVSNRAAVKVLRDRAEAISFAIKCKSWRRGYGSRQRS